MFLSVFFCLLSGYTVHGFLPVSPLTDCPNISPQDGLKIEQIVGTWRLAYLLIDDTDEFEEDSTCAVAEIMQINETKLELLLYVDGRKDEYTIDRYTKEFDISVVLPGQWLLHTSFASMEYIHVTVIGFSSKHLILTFCVDAYKSEESTLPQTEPINDYDSFLAMSEQNDDDLIKLQNYNGLFKEADDISGKLRRHRRIRRPLSLLRGKRFAGNPVDESYEKIMKYFKEKSVKRQKKHLGTVILVKDNNVSALRFVENASILMKYGFKIKEGQLVSFGSCSLTRK